MKVSLNSLKQFTSVDISLDELVKKINEQLGKVEGTTDLAMLYADALIVRVVTATKHPNADRLTICRIDDGHVIEGLERDQDGLIQVVCGAPNVSEAMFAIWLPPGMTVPATESDKEPLVLSAREIRGVVSNGMLAAADELAIGNDHEGIIELTKTDLPYNSEVELTPGLNFAKTFGLDDTVLEIENKMFTHRPDCFGQLGVAREIAGILGAQFTSPDWYVTSPKFDAHNDLELNVVNSAGKNVPRFMAIAMKDVVIGPSPFWLQCELVRMGGKPLNNVVDITNYMMLLTGQPMHAYDYDSLSGHTIGARMAFESEKVTLLNGKTYTLTPEDIVIFDGEEVVGLGGVMGGGNSE
ncbi:hypothetical protein B7Z28_01760, partial [Candidatus Saccharibacteria bacterium 32-45-3]